MVQIVGREVGQTGFGLMGLTWRPTPTPHEQAFDTLKSALASGATFWNGGEFYGDMMKGPNSLTLLNAYFTKYPEDADKVILSIKGGAVPPFKMHTSNEDIRTSIDNCLRQLPPSVKKIDIFEVARIDPDRPVREQLETVEQLRSEGKFGAVGLSEVKAETIRLAASITKVAAVEVEVSLWETTYLENGVMETCAELGIPLVAYSPLGRGFLTGEITKPSDIPEGDFRRMVPRFSEENFPKNLELVHKLQEVAKKKGVSPAQLALGWVRGLNGRKGYPQILPIPGATTRKRVEENGQAVTLSTAEEKEIDDIMSSITVLGTRYPEHSMAALEG